VSLVVFGQRLNLEDWANGAFPAGSARVEPAQANVVEDLIDFIKDIFTPDPPEPPPPPPEDSGGW